MALPQASALQIRLRTLSPSKSSGSVHKVFLTTNSKVFASLFESDRDANCIDIPNDPKGSGVSDVPPCEKSTLFATTPLTISYS